MKNIIFLFLTMILFSCDFADKFLGVNERLIEEDEPPLKPGYYTSIAAAKADSVISYWDLDESSGATSVDQAGAKNGTNNGSLILGGKFYNGRYYDGTANVTYNNIATYNLFVGGQYTISFWVNIGSIVANTYFYAFTTPNLYFYVSAATTFGVTYGATTRTYTPVSMASFVNNWTHFVIVYNVNTSGQTANTLTLYINGVSLGSQVYASTVPSGATARFASTGTGTGNIQASFDDIAIWNRALSASEVSAVYNCGGPLIKK